MSTNKISKEVLARAREMEEIGKRAVEAAQEENRRLGLPNVYWSPERGTYYELPDGTITSESPFKTDDDKK